MLLYGVDYPGIEAHAHVIGEHLFEAFLLSCYLLLIFDIVDGSLREGLNLDVPHVIKTDLTCHPFLY